MKIRRRDGSLVEVPDNYVLADGESFSLALQFMDAGRPLIHDARGEPAGTRPGFLIGDNAAADKARIDAYRQYDDAISSRWRTGPTAQPARSAPPASQAIAPPTFASPQAAQAARDAAYAEYNRTIQDRWRSK